MKKLFCVLILFLSCICLANEMTGYQCLVTEFPVSSPDKFLELGGPKGKVVDSILIKSGQYKVQVELYFQNVQIHIFDLQENLISTSAAPEITSSLSSSLKDVAKIVCLRR